MCRMLSSYFLVEEGKDLNRKSTSQEVNNSDKVKQGSRDTIKDWKCLENCCIFREVSAVKKEH